MIDLLSSTRVAPGHTWKAYTSAPLARWPGAFTVMVRAGARNSAKQITVLPEISAKAFQPPASGDSTARLLGERDTKATHKRRRPARRPAAQAYRVWSKRRQISRRHAVKLHGVIHMQEVIPAPLEEVFLVRPVMVSFCRSLQLSLLIRSRQMEEILPAPLLEFEASGLVHAGTPNSYGLPDTNAPVLACNFALGRDHLEPRADHPSLHSCQPPISAFCCASNAASHAGNLVRRAADRWRYVGHPFKSFDEACATQHIQPGPSVLELGAPAPSPLTSALDDICDVSLGLPSSARSRLPLTNLGLGDDGVFLVGGAEHAGVRGHAFVKCAPVPDASVDGGEDAGGQIELTL